MIDRQPGDLISEIRMTNSDSPGKIYWLVEGVSDRKFFSRRVSSNVEIIPATGKYVVISALELYARDESAQNIPVLGIIDNDYDWITNPARPNHIVSTEPRDLEGVLLRSDTVQAVLAEYDNDVAVADFERENRKSIISAAIEKALIFGKIRAVNSLFYRKELKKFKPLQFFEKNWTYDEEKVLRKAVELGVGESVEDLKIKISELPDADCWHYVRGHDAIDVLCGGLIYIFKCSVDAKKVEPILRQSFTYENLSKTKIYREICAWHVNNKLDIPFLSP